MASYTFDANRGANKTDNDHCDDIIVEHEDDYINDDANWVVGSMDIIGLYIESKPARVGEETCQCVRESDWELETDPNELGKLATLLYSRKELIEKGLHNCVPTARDPTKIPNQINLFMIGALSLAIWLRP